MTLELTDWDEDLPVTADEEYQALVRTLKFTDGFGLLFVRCSPSQGQQLVNQVKEDISDKNIEVLELNEPVNNLYQIIDELNNKQKLDILFITGLEQSLLQYEQCKALSGWDIRDTHSYSWKGVPPVLINLNQQRERFRENFNTCFVFLLPIFAIKYFIQRAPDFFDWRSGLFEFPIDEETFKQETSRILQDADYEKYLTLTPEERNRKIIDIQELISADNQNIDYKAIWLTELGNLHFSGKDYAKSLLYYDQAVSFNLNNYQFWDNRGNVLINLGRYEEAVSSYDKALNIKPDDYKAWYNRGNALMNLGRYEEAVSSYDKALNIKPDDYKAWYNKGNSLFFLKKYQSAIYNYDRAIDITPQDYQLWYQKAEALRKLGLNEEAITNYNKVITLKSDEYWAWYHQGLTFSELVLYENAIFSYDKALKINCENIELWGYRGIAFYCLGKYEDAIANYDKALEMNPKSCAGLYYYKACCLAKLHMVELAIENLQRAISINQEKYKRKASNNSDFDSIKDDERFKNLMKNQ